MHNHNTKLLKYISDNLVNPDANFDNNNSSQSHPHSCIATNPLKNLYNYKILNLLKVCA